MRLCIVCKSEIDAERIETVPKTRLCTQHAIEIQQYGGEFKMVASQERTSKAGSLKINYGGVETSSTRNDDALDRLVEDYRTRESAS